MKLAITPTLLGSFDWCLNAPSSWKERAFRDFAATIRREKKEYGIEAQKGVEFEDNVYAVCDAISAGSIQNTQGTKLFQSVVEKCIGGRFQEWGQLYFDVEEIGTFRAYGKLDVNFDVGSERHPAGHIIDLKTTVNYKGEAKYLSGWQHLMYCLSKNVPTFEYLVAEWQAKGVFKLAQIHSVQYTMTDKTAALEAIKGHTRKFIAFLKAHNLYDDYIYVYCKNPR